MKKLNNYLLIALVLTFTACTSNLHALNKTRAFAQAATTIAHTAANYARQNKLKTAGMVIGTWLIADLGGHAIYNKAVKKLKAWKIASAEKKVQYLQKTLQEAQEGLAQTNAHQPADELDQSIKDGTIDLLQREVQGLPGMIAQETANRDRLQQEYAALKAKPSFTKHLVSAIAAKIF